MCIKSARVSKTVICCLNWEQYNVGDLIFTKIVIAYINCFCWPPNWRNLNMDTILVKGERFINCPVHSLLFLPPTRKGFIKGEALRRLKKLFSEIFRWEYNPIQNTPVCERLPEQSSRKNNVRIQIQWKEVGTSTKRDSAEEILPFLTTYHSAVPDFKNILISKWH